MQRMRIDIITLFPEMFECLNVSMTGIAQDKALLSLHYWNPRDYTESKHGRVDDRPYGGGPGMVLQYQPLRDAILAAKAADPEPAPVIYLSPQGALLHQAKAQSFVQNHRLILLCGHYEGIDERLIEHHVDSEYSIGDFVCSGGELPAMVLIDVIARLLPGTLGDPLSATQDSFSQGLLDHPHYTRPPCIDGYAVPPILLSGNHQAIETWRKKQALGKTWQKRPDLLKRRTQSDFEQMLLSRYQRGNHEE